MFPGQGSQYFNMGRELYAHHQRFRLWMDHCDEVVSDLTGTSLLQVIYQPIGKAGFFDEIRYTNPALLAIEYSVAKVVMEMGIKPDVLLGYSLGEFVAAVVSGCCSLEEGMKLVIEYAALIEESCPPGGMLAILAKEHVMDDHPALFKDCWMAARNFETNFVVSGLAGSIDRLQAGLTDKGIVCQRLPVNYPFHTELIEWLEEPFKSLAAKVAFSKQAIPVVSSMTGRRVETLSSEHLWEVCRNTVGFARTVRDLDRSGECLFLDLGPSGSLSTAVKYALPPKSRSSHLEFLNQFGRDLVSVARFEASFRVNAVANVG
jgi:bacillaene synthase trans-acting acyltransferase